MEEEPIITPRIDENGTLIQEVEPFVWNVPECCREGWDSCKHVAKKPKPVKRNIAL